MTILAQDDFSGTSNELLTSYNSDWSQITSVTGTSLARISNEQRVRGGINVSAWKHAGTDSSTRKVSADLYRVGNTEYSAAGVMFAYDGDYGVAYTARIQWRSLVENSKVYLHKPTLANPTSNSIASTNFQIPLETITRLTLEMEGDVLRVFIDDTLYIEHTDPEPRAITGGGIVLHGYVNNSDTVGIHVDNFLVEDGGSAPARRLPPLLLTPW